MTNTNTTAKKATKAEMFAQILTHLTDEEEIKFINHELEQLAKKNSRRAEQMSETQQENAKTAEEILAWMTTRPNKCATSAEIRNHTGLSPQKIAPIMGKLEKAGRVTVTIEKRVKIFHTVD